jgi:hypothetical protein
LVLPSWGSTLLTPPRVLFSDCDPGPGCACVHFSYTLGAVEQDGAVEHLWVAAAGTPRLQLPCCYDFPVANWYCPPPVSAGWRLPGAHWQQWATTWAPKLVHQGGGVRASPWCSGCVHPIMQILPAAFALMYCALNGILLLTMPCLLLLCAACYMVRWMGPVVESVPTSCCLSATTPEQVRGVEGRG